MPIEAGALVGHRPATVVDAATDKVEAYDIGAELGEGHAAGGGGDERAAFDDS